MEKILHKRKYWSPETEKIIKIKKKKVGNCPDTLLIQQGVAVDAISRITADIHDISTEQQRILANPPAIQIYKRVKDTERIRQLQAQDKAKDYSLFTLTSAEHKPHAPFIPPIPTATQETQKYLKKKSEEQCQSRKRMIMKRREMGMKQVSCKEDELLYCNEKPVAIENYDEILGSRYEYYTLAYEDEPTSNLNNMYEESDSEKSIDYPSSESSGKNGKGDESSDSL